MTQKDKTRQ